ncbi:MAG TPA: DeoR/GlpR family DNA-binding transcription regulator [Puia sp.]|nr:DeoR/GlpR family DNA-binding transcription regulator [Puia sp.]
MNFQKRKAAIIRQIETTGEGEVRDLAKSLHVSEITIRRDLKRLAGDGVLMRTHGGAIRVPSTPPAYPFAEKIAANAKAKEAIARRAAAEINDGDTLFLDCGSSVFHLCPYIRNKKIRIITNSLPVIRELANSSVEINVIGGEFDRERQAVHGRMAGFHIAQYRADKAFLGIDGICAQGLFANSEKEADLTLALAAGAKTAIILCDSSKIGRAGYLRFAGLDLPETVITDAPAAHCQFLIKAGIKVIVV